MQPLLPPPTAQMIPTHRFAAKKNRWECIDSKEHYEILNEHSFGAAWNSILCRLSTVHTVWKHLQYRVHYIYITSLWWTTQCRILVPILLHFSQSSFVGCHFLFSQRRENKSNVECWTLKIDFDRLCSIFSRNHTTTHLTLSNKITEWKKVRA